MFHIFWRRQIYGTLKNRIKVFNFSNRSSVSEEETVKFSRMADEWWNPKKNPLISMNPTRISFIIQTLVPEAYSSTGTMTNFEPLRGLRMLDVGCGGGLLSESLARLGADVTAIDPSSRIVEAAKQHSSKGDEWTKSISYHGGISIEDMAKDYRSKEEDSKFDAICILEVVEHASDPTLLVESAASILKKPDGVLFISTINRTSKSFFLAIIAGEYITRMLPIGTHSFNKFITPGELSSLANSCGLKQISTKGMVLDPRIFDLRWRLEERDLDVNYISAYRHKNLV